MAEILFFLFFGFLECFATSACRVLGHPGLQQYLRASADGDEADGNDDDNGDDGGDDEAED